jgi:Dolichyl-phosphate-mannose-protein mannosyltransferase
VLRLGGLAFGLPELFHPDEPAYVLQALAVARGLPDGLTFANPPLFKYLLLVDYAFAFGVGRLLGTTGSPQDFVNQFRADPSQLYLIARATSAVVGAATTIAAFALGAEVGGRRVGLISAALAAIAYLMVRDSHFGVNDALVTLLVTGGLVFCVRVARVGRRRDYVLAGALTGLAFAAKYQGLALLAPLTLAHLLRSSQRRRANLMLSSAACLAVAVVGFPSLVTEPGKVMRDVYEHLYLSATSGYDGLDPAGGYVSYAKALGIGLGWPLLLTAVAGIALSVVRRHRALLVLGSLPLVLFLVLGSQQLFFARFLLPAVPALLVEAAVVVDAVATIRPALGLGLALLVAIPTLSDSVRFDVLLGRDDTRRLARDWIEANLADGSRLVVDAAPLGPTLSARRLNVLVANDWSLFDFTPTDYSARGVDYMVTSSFTADARAIDAARDARRLAFYADLRISADVVAEFRPFSGSQPPPFVYDQIYAPFSSLSELERPGPTVTVFRLSAGRDRPP